MSISLAAPAPAPLGVSVADAVLEAVSVIDGTVGLLQGLMQVACIDPEGSGVVGSDLLRTMLTKLELVERRLCAGKVRVVQIAEQEKAGQGAGFTGTAAWVANSTGSTRRDAATLTGLAERLRACDDAGGDAERSQTLRALEMSDAAAAHLNKMFNS